MAINESQAGIDDAHIRSVEEILAQERLEAEARSKELKQKLSNVANKAKKMSTTLEGMSKSLDGMKDKLETMSQLFGEDTELGKMFADLSSGVDSLKEDTSSISDETKDNETKENTTQASTKAPSVEDSSVKKETTEATKPATQATNAVTPVKDTKESMYVPPVDTLKEIKGKANQSKAAGHKGKVLTYTSEQMTQMNPSDLSNVIKTGFASDMKSQPVVSYLTSQFGAAQFAAQPVVNMVVKKVKKLPELVKKDFAFSKMSLDINAPSFDASDFLTTAKDTSQLYESAFEYGDMFFNDDKRVGDVEDEHVATHESPALTTEEIVANREAKFGRADADIDYSMDTELDYGMTK